MDSAAAVDMSGMATDGVTSEVGPDDTSRISPDAGPAGSDVETTDAPLEVAELDAADPDGGPTSDVVNDVQTTLDISKADALAALDQGLPPSDIQGPGDGGQGEDTGVPFDNGLEPLDEVVEPGPAPEWLLSIDNGSKTLQRVNIDTGETTDLCQLSSAVGGFVSYPSLTFTRSNYLYASRSGVFLDLIDPCTCQVEPIGDYGVWSGVNGITSDQGVQLMGAASTQDEMISIQTKTGQGTKIGDLGVDFTTHGATWSDSIKALYAINGDTDALYVIDPATGVASFKVALSQDFGTVGIELLPANGIIYACSTAADLLTVDPETGVVEVVGPMNQLGPCTNLAAPWKAVPCVE